MPGIDNWLNLNLIPGDTSNLTKQLACQFNLGTVKKLSINDAADYTADIIYQKYKDLYLSFSGGLDSMFVANVLYRNKIPFKPIIFDWYWQEPECWHAYDWCEKHQIEPIVCTITKDTEQEFLEKILKYALQVKTPAKIGYIPIILAQTLPITGRLITGYGEPFYNSVSYSEPMGDVFEIAEHDYYMNLVYGSDHPGGFLSYTPEMFFSLVRNIPNHLNTQQAKAEIYGLEFRPKFNNINVLPWGKYQTLRDKINKPFELTVQRYHKTSLLKLL